MENQMELLCNKGWCNQQVMILQIGSMLDLMDLMENLKCTLRMHKMVKMLMVKIPLQLLHMAAFLTQNSWVQMHNGSAFFGSHDQSCLAPLAFVCSP